MARYNKISTDMVDRLACAGVTVDDEAEIDMTKTPLVD